MWLAPLRAIADLSSYREALKRSNAWLAGYLAYLSFLFAILGVVAVHRRIVPVMRETVDWAAEKVPVVTLRDGRAESSATGPVRLEHPRLKDFAFIIDTTRATPVTAGDLEKANAVGMLTQDALYLQAQPGRVEKQELGLLRMKDPVVLDAGMIRAMGSAAIRLLYPASFVALWLLFFARKLFAAAGYSLIALILNGALEAGLPYADLWKLAVVAQAPAAALEMARLFLPRAVPYFGLITLIAGTVYLWQAVNLNRREPTEAPASIE